MTLESPEGQGEAAIEARGLRVASDRLTIARRRLAPPPRPAERHGQVHERSVGGRLDAERLREGLGRVAVTALADQGEPAPDMRHGVAWRKARRLAKGRLGLDEAPETHQGPAEILVRLGERGDARDGSPEGRFLVVGPGLPAAHERLSEMREAVVRFQSSGFGIRGLGLGPAALPLEGYPKLEVGPRRSRRELESRGEALGGFDEAPLIEQDLAELHVRGGRARPALHDAAKLHLRFVQATLAAQRGAQERAELRVARVPGEGHATQSLGLRELPTAERLRRFLERARLAPRSRHGPILHGSEVG